MTFNQNALDLLRNISYFTSRIQSKSMPKKKVYITCIYIILRQFGAVSRILILTAFQSTSGEIRHHPGGGSALLHEMLGLILKKTIKPIAVTFSNQLQQVYTALNRNFRGIVQVSVHYSFTKPDTRRWSQSPMRYVKSSPKKTILSRNFGEHCTKIVHYDRNQIIYFYTYHVWLRQAGVYLCIKYVFSFWNVKEKPRFYTKTYVFQ